jgi:hypothetical protein
MLEKGVDGCQEGSYRLLGVVIIELIVLVGTEHHDARASRHVLD